MSSENDHSSHSTDSHSEGSDSHSHEGHSEPVVAEGHSGHSGNPKKTASGKKTRAPLSRGMKLAIASTAFSLSALGGAAFFLLKPSHSPDESASHGSSHGDEEHHAGGDSHKSESHHDPVHAQGGEDHSAEASSHGTESHGAEPHRAPAESHAETAHTDSAKSHHSEDGHGAPAEAHGSDEHGAEIHESQAGFIGKVRHWAHSIQSKAEGLQRAEEENERLRVENANLRFKVESLRFDCHVRNAETQTRIFEKQLVEETGTKAGRVLASLNYRPPGHLNPGQLYTLAVSYFKAREDEKSAVLLTMLTEMRENSVYKVPKNFLMTGIAWYRLDNLDLADLYFSRVIESQENEAYLPYQAQARLWRALVANRLGKPVRAQFWLRELVDHHPRSLEASWVNRIAGGDLQRSLASPEASHQLLDRVEKLKKESHPSEGHDAHH